MPARSAGRDAFAPPAFAAPRALYVHVPLCVSACSYCDFHSVAAGSLDEALVDRLIEATLERARALADRFGARGFDTVYVGGGTPTCLAPRQLDALLRGIEGLAGRPGEWTVEANPESLDDRALGSIAERGATRLSLGIQSLDAGELAVLGRAHDAGRAIAAMELAVASGLSVSVDFIAGAPVPVGRASAPNRPLPLRDQVRVPLELGVEHVSIYDLVLEEGSPLSRSVARGELALRDPDQLWEARAEAEELLGSRGLARYEVSNYARPGRECRHNEAYWRMDSYLGAGPSAVGTLAAAPEPSLADPGSAALRIEETRDIAAYLEDPGAAAIETTISRAEAAFETLMMAFRTARGIDPDRYRARFGLELGDSIGRTLGAWKDRIVLGPGRVALDGKGLDLLNRFLVDCLAEMEGRPSSSGGGGTG